MCIRDSPQRLSLRAGTDDFKVPSKLFGRVAEPGKSRIERVVVIRDGKLRDAQPHRLVDHLLRRVGPVGKSRVNVIVDHTHLMPESVTPSTKCF